MACESVCRWCRGDATRCDCWRLYNQGRLPGQTAPPPPVPTYEERVAERIARNEAEIAINMARLERMASPRRRRRSK